MNRAKPLYEHSVNLKIPFHDIDSMQVVWHGHYLKYFEIARDELFSHAGIDLHLFFNKSQYLFPIIRATVKYICPLHLRDEIICTAQVRDAKRKIVIDFSIRRISDSLICATGTTEQVAVQFSGTGMELEIPLEIRQALGYKK
jgi:acyl-CoA thioester hydrolase